MDNQKESYFIAFISLLILNMLIIFFGIFSYFFSIKDYTLIAGIIAFFGAIIGGAITLIGVRKTIDNTNKIRDLDTIPIKLESINKFYNELNGVYEVIFIKDCHFNRAFRSANETLKYIEERTMVTKSLMISQLVHDEFQNLIQRAKVVMYENLGIEDHPENYSAFLDEVKLKIDGINKTLDKEAIRLSQSYFNLKKSHPI